MNVGIICEYNPFHNGHLYHIKKIKELYPNANIILVMSSLFTQRGESSLLNKWDKTDISLSYGVDLVVELPFVFSTQSADIFAKGAIEILKNLKTDFLVFGSECNDINLLKEMANIQNTKNFNDIIKNELDKGMNYPSAISNAIKKIVGKTIDSPNDLLAISYIKEIIKQNANITPICIKRTNDYHDENLSSFISSATSIRKALNLKKNVKNYVPEKTYYYLNSEFHFIDEYFDLLKYKIIVSKDLQIYQTVDEGLSNRIKSQIIKSNSLEELIKNIKTKRYTYNKIKRMLLHILCDFTKEEANRCKESEYIRILGFNEKGKNLLNKCKKTSKLPIITGYSNIKSEILNIEFRVSNIYYLIYKEKKNYLMELEYKHSPIIK